MALVKHFRRLAFAQVVLGIVAFCMAERNPGLLLVAGAIAALSWYVTEGPSGKPLPKAVTNLAGLFSVGWLVWDMVVGRGHVIVAIGHLIMALQIVMLYAGKQNRDYVQLLVLSLLQMVGASVLSVSMIFGVLLVAYSALALWTVLLFQLKITSDQVHAAHQAASPRPAGVGEPTPVVGRGHRWQFQFTAMAIGVVCFGIGIAVFVVMPRTGEGRMGNELAGPVAGRSLTGFSKTVNLGSTPGPPRSTGPVLNLRLSMHGKSLKELGMPLLLRGAALDTYNPHDHSWTRSNTWGLAMETRSLPEDGLELTPMPDSALMLHGQITIRSAQQNTLFTVFPPASIDSQSLEQVMFSEVDDQLESDQPLSGAVMYSINWPMGAARTRADRTKPQSEEAGKSSTPSLAEGFDPYEPSRLLAAGRAKADEVGAAIEYWTRREEGQRTNHAKARAEAKEPSPSDPWRSREPKGYAQGWPVEPQRVAKLTRRVLADRGLSRTSEGGSDARDRRIARALADYLSTTYRYTLENPQVRRSRDPVIDFLFNRKRGHCELFAAAHAAMCRSIGMKARVVSGYRASEFNDLGGYYVVRPADAHAWTEVYVGPGLGWQTFDATPSQAVQAEHRRSSGWLRRLRGYYEHAEFLWIRTIVAFNRRTRAAMMDDMERRIHEATESRQSWTGQVIAFVRELPRHWRLEKIGYTAAGIVIVMLGLALASLARLLILRRRKLAALQLTALPRTRRRGLARKLRFYLSMLEMLERHGYSRPEWQSPFGFAQELADANPLRFDPVVALTEIFYEVRFGHRELDADRRNRIRAHLKALERALAERRAGGGRG